MPTTIHPFSCLTARVRVIITEQTFPSIGGIGEDIWHSQSDYGCSHQDRCDRRHDRACAVYRLNKGTTGSQGN